MFWGLLGLEVAALLLAVRGAWQLSAKAGNFSRSWQQIQRDPLVLVLTFALADEVAVELIHHALAGVPKPWAGWRQAAYHLSVAIVLGWPALLAGAAWSMFARPPAVAVPGPHPYRDHGHNSASRSSDATTVIKSAPMSDRVRDLLFGAWLAAAGGLGACYPLPRGWTAPILHAVELLFVAVALASIPAGWRSRAIVTREGRALGVVLVTELGVAVLGAWGAGSAVFTEWDALARVPYAIGWGALVVVLARR